MQRPGFSSYAPRNVVVTLIAVNVAVWIADFFSAPTVVDRHTVGSPRPLAQRPDGRPRLHAHSPVVLVAVPYGRLRPSPADFRHILGNMLVLFFLGRDVEETYGSKEFLRLYLVMVVFALGGVERRQQDRRARRCRRIAIGASGAITGIVVLYALNFPDRTLLLFFVIPMPAWLAGVLFVGLDMFGALAGDRAMPHRVFRPPGRRRLRLRLLSAAAGT